MERSLTVKTRADKVSIVSVLNLKFDTLPLRHLMKTKSLTNLKLKNNVMNLSSLVFLQHASFVTYHSVDMHTQTL